jgi:fimbrial chaperone protein
MRITNVIAGAAIVCATLLAAAPAASAATFSVNPTQIFLGGRTSSALLTLRNDSDEVLRFQLTAFAWQQSVAGEIELADTQDVVFFPALLTLQPREERKIRVGSTTAAGAVEKTYRIFVDELPGAASGEPTSVRVLTKMGIPIFVRPAKESANATLDALGMRDGTLHFAVNNTGTVHFVPQHVKVRGIAANGEPLFDQALTAWYILPGGRRDFDMAIAAAECGRTESIVVEVGLGATALKETLQTPGGACRR